MIDAAHDAVRFEVRFPLLYRHWIDRGVMQTLKRTYDRMILKIFPSLRSNNVGMLTNFDVWSGMNTPRAFCAFKSLGVLKDEHF